MLVKLTQMREPEPLRDVWVNPAHVIQIREAQRFEDGGTSWLWLVEFEQAIEVVGSPGQIAETLNYAIWSGTGARIADSLDTIAGDVRRIALELKP